MKIRFCGFLLICLQTATSRFLLVFSFSVNPTELLISSVKNCNGCWILWKTPQTRIDGVFWQGVEEWRRSRRDVFPRSRFFRLDGDILHVSDHFNTRTDIQGQSPLFHLSNIILYLMCLVTSEIISHSERERERERD